MGGKKEGYQRNSMKYGRLTIYLELEHGAKKFVEIEFILRQILCQLLSPVEKFNMHYCTKL